ncbi:MAG: hypothetical protein KKD28_07375 [Chloroflexi bacterium]|nr:hypothetical protein [Chloroflexota bacterium]
MRINISDTQKIQDTLEAGLPDHVWLRVLEILLPSGVADSLHLRRATGLNRDKLRRSLDKMEVAAVGLPPIIRLLDHTIPRAGVRGRAPNVYLLGESGAALLRANGYSDARTCGLNNDRAIAHALAMLSVHFAAQQYGQDIITDKTISYRDGQILRPDHRVTLADGHQILIEVEQAAKRILIPRIQKSLSNKQAFFHSPEGQDFLPEIRMLINLPRGRDWQRTLNVWREVCNLIVQHNGATLAFRLLALPLNEFIDTAEWEADVSKRWEDLSVSIQTTASGEHDDADSAPDQVVEHSQSAYDDYITLNALAQQYQETLVESDQHPDRYFFHLVMLIYTASHDDSYTSLEQATVPHASVYLLKRYLEMNPKLRTSLQKTLHHGRNNIRWNTTAVLHRMQSVINLVLRYHGWENSNDLQVRAGVGSWDAPGPYGINVNIMPVFPEIVQQAGKPSVNQALAWVLWAIFEYAGELGLRRPVFW